jgi:hypothetical protein
MSAAAVCPANMRRPEMHPTAAACSEAYSAAVPAKAAAMSAKASEVSATTTMPTATTTMPTATAAMSPAATAPSTAGVCLECEKRHDDKHHRGNANAGRQYQIHGAAGLGAPHRRSQLSLAIPPRTKSF